MATVYITKELISRVEKKIEYMRRAERSSDLPNIDKNFSVDASMLYNIGCWGADNIHLIDMIPKDWLSQQTDANIHIYGTIDDGVALKTNVRFNGLTSAYQRPSSGYYNRSDSELYLGQLLAFPDETPGRAELLQRWDDALVELSINNKWGKVKTDITEFLYKCKSLNEAVKLYPGVRMYLDCDDIQRMERKVERISQRAKIVDDVDTEGLTAAAIAAKLAMAA